jgi:hypothetical protein
MQENPPEGMSITEHVHEAWQLLLHLPDGERALVTEFLAERYDWSQVEMGAIAMRHASLVAALADPGTGAIPAPADRLSSEVELAEVTDDLTPADVAKVRSLVEALRDGVVTVAELHELPDWEWLELIASRRAA